MDAQNNVVLGCIDGSAVSRAVCDYSAWIAKSVSAPLKLLHTIEHPREPAIADFSGAIGLGSREELLRELTQVEQERSRLQLEEGRLMLNAAKGRVIEAGAQPPELCQRHGSLAESLIELEDRIRLLVIGIRGETHADQSGVSTQLESIVRALHKPILVVNREYTQPKRCMLAYDGSPACKKALDMMTSSPLFKTLPCHVVNVGDNAQPLLDEASAILSNAGVEVKTAQLNGKIVNALCTYQHENDIGLTVMGAFSHNRVRDFLLGSFTHNMLEKTQRPLLLLR